MMVETAKISIDPCSRVTFPLSPNHGMGERSPVCRQEMKGGRNFLRDHVAMSALWPNCMW